MKLFLIEIRMKKRPRRGRQLVVHARTKRGAEAHVAERFTGCEILSSIELPSVTKHFVIADLDL